MRMYMDVGRGTRARSVLGGRMLRSKNQSSRHSAGPVWSPRASVAVAQLRAVVLMLITQPG